MSLYPTHTTPQPAAHPPTQAAALPPVLTAAMAADLLQVHVEYLRRMVREGRLPSHRFPGGRELRFLRDELLAWLAAQPGAGMPAAASAAPVTTEPVEPTTPRGARR